MKEFETIAETAEMKELNRLKAFEEKARGLLKDTMERLSYCPANLDMIDIRTSIDQFLMQDIQQWPMDITRLSCCFTKLQDTLKIFEASCNDVGMTLVLEMERSPGTDLEVMLDNFKKIPNRLNVLRIRCLLLLNDLKGQLKALSDKDISKFHRVPMGHGSGDMFIKHVRSCIPDITESIAKHNMRAIGQLQIAQYILKDTNPSEVPNNTQ